MPPGKTLRRPLPAPVSSNSAREGGLPASPSFNESRKLKLTILLNDSGAHLAGTSVKGFLEVAVSSNELWLGEIGMTLEGLEELRSKDHTSTRRILSQRVDFQGGHLPPSNAVVAGSLPSNGAYPALRGKTRFPFAFKLPQDLPSSCSLGANGPATTRYELRAFASSVLGGNVENRSERHAVQVVERWKDWDEGDWTVGVERRAAERLKLAGDGQLSLTVAVGKDEWSETPLRLFWRGEQDMGWSGKGRIELRARVRNASLKHISGLKVSLCRRLRVLYPKGETPVVAPPSIVSVVVVRHCSGPDFDFRAGEEREVSLSIDVPKEECWSKRKGILWELDCFVRVEVDCGFLSKDLSVEVPIWIAHPISLHPTAHEHVQSRLQSAAIAPSFPTPPVFPGVNPSPAPWLHPQHSAPGNDFVPHGTYSPVSSSSSHGLSQHSHSTSSSSSHGAPLYHRPSVTVAATSSAPYFASPPPAQSGHLQQAYIAFDPNAPDLTQSRFLDSLQQAQPAQAYVPPNSSMSIGLGTPSPASTRSNSPLQQQQQQQFSVAHAVVFAPPPPPPPILSPPPPGSSASASHSYTPYVLSPSTFAPNLSPEETAQIAHNIGPTEPYSVSARSVRGRTESTPPATYQPVVPPNPSPSPVPMHRSHSASSIGRPMRTPPPPSPSTGASRFSPSLVHSPASQAPIEGVTGLGSDPLLLETIGEDGESQAGTARSMQAEMLRSLAGLKEGDEDPAVLARQMDTQERRIPEVQSPKAQSRPFFGSRNSATDLEDLVAEQEKRQTEAEQIKTEYNKTLPSPPVPSNRTKPTSSPTIPLARDIFAANPSSSTAPPASDHASRARSTSPPKQPPRSGGGLSALEARLSRPSNPDLAALLSRSPSPTKLPATSESLSPPRSARSPSPSKEEGFGGALLARSLSRATSERELRKRLEETELDPKEEVRKAVEKASWASIGKKVEGASAVGNGREELAPMGEKSVVDPPKPSTGRPTFASKRKAVPYFDSAPTTSTPVTGPTRPTVATETKFIPPTTTSAAVPLPSSSSPLAPLPHDAAPSTSPITSPTILNGRKVVDISEVKGLQKEAVGRVADWLKSDESSNQAGEKAVRRRTTDLTFARVAPSPPTTSSAVTSSPMTKAPSPWTSKAAKGGRTEGLVTSISSRDLVSAAVDQKADPPAPAPLPNRPAHKHTKSLPAFNRPEASEPTIAELLAEEEKSGGLAQSQLPSLKSNGRLATKNSEDIGSRYDVKSARGGQGGVVASRANRWKELIEGEEREKSKSPPPPVAAPRALKIKSTPFDTTPSQPLSPINNLRSTRTPSAAASPISASAAKKTSAAAPAFLNTTMGKPAVLSGAVRAQPSMLMRTSVSSPSLSTSDSAPKGGVRVKDLLSRYAEQVAAQK